MKAKSNSTRRRFFAQASAVLSVPLAAMSARATQRDAGDGAKARLTALEDVNAIRELQRTFARLVNSGAHEAARSLFATPSTARVDERIRHLSADGFGEDETIEVAANRRAAATRTRCTVRTEIAIGPNCTLVEMAREQGEGVLRRSENRVLVGAFVKRGDVWKIDRLTFEPL